MERVSSGKDAPGEMACPQCGAIIPVYDGFVAWCDQCEWNLKPQQPRAAGTIFESFYARLGARLGDKLFEDVAHHDPELPRLSLSRPLAFVCAGLVHALTLGAGVVGLILLVGATQHGWMLLAGVLCLATAWFTRPRIERVTHRGIARDRAPYLYHLTDRVAAALGAQPVGKIVLDSSFNASLSREGWRGSYVLTLGLRLFAILDQEERVALIAHELAHQVNGDIAQSRIITLAVSSLARWYAALRPLRLALSLGFTEVVYLYAGLLSHLCWRTSQRAEYRADLLSTQVAGTAAVLSLLDKLHLVETLRAAPARPLAGEDCTLFDELRCRLAAVPTREWERIRRVERLCASSLDATHPPTAYRIALLEEAPTTTPTIVLADEETTELADELVPIERLAHQRILAAVNRSSETT